MSVEKLDLYKGKRYDLWTDFEEDFEEYKEKKQQDFTIFRCTKLSKDHELMYRNVTLNCVYGEHRDSESTGERASS